jgi:hypothetical protein
MVHLGGGESREKWGSNHHLGGRIISVISRECLMFVPEEFLGAVEHSRIWVRRKKAAICLRVTWGCTPSREFF